MNVELTIEDIPTPRITSPDEVILRVGAAGLCRTDLHIMAGVWKDGFDPDRTLLPIVLGHENAGWVEEVGSAVKTVKPGDAVICHPLCTCGICLSCRDGNDQYCDHWLYPGGTGDGGFAEYMVTKARSLVKLDPNILPVEVAPLADAGVAAYHAAKRAVAQLRPGSFCVVLGVGGLGHIALQTLHETTDARIIAVDRSEPARALARELGADHVLDSGPDTVSQVRELTHGGAHVVLDFVGEHGAEQSSWQMLRRGGMHLVVGYGGTIEVPTAHLMILDLTIAGSLLGNYRDLVDLMTLNADGRVKLHTRQYTLNDINNAIDDLKQGQLAGRAVIVPGD